ncbi:MAG: HRDC domain-containing protein [Chloroflexi bacterium]|nr:HRDC domain-containing protein [Chloroflexota bacterium]
MDRLPRLIDTPKELVAVTAALREEPLIAVDTESNAFHAYRPRVCLVQLADRGREWAVDPLALDDLTPLRDLLNAPGTVKVLHAAEGDILALRRDYDFGVAPVFDTMMAARALGRRRYGLADLLAEHFDVTLDKRYQRHDWRERPIPAPALRYAAADVRHLPALHDVLREQLVATGRMEEAGEEFQRVSRSTPEDRPFDPESFWRIKGARDLPPRSRAVLRALYTFRDGRARSQDRPPVKVLSDDALLALSRIQPHDAAGLRHAGLTPLQADRYGSGLLAAVRAAQNAPTPEPPRGNGPPPDQRVIARYDALRAWRKEVAAERGVEPDVLLPNAALRALSRAAPRSVEEAAFVAELGPWKTRAYAAQIVRVMREIG